jgi:D-alanyl-D-alanine carboxypeptidase (penicillin-binding protein 5/6)
MRSNGLSWRLLLAAAFSALSLCVIASSYSRAAVDNGDVSVKAPHAIIMDAERGAVLFQRDADELVAPASMSKLMTLEMAFKALKAGEIKSDTEFLMSEYAWRTGGAPSGTSAMFVPIGTKASVEELLKGIIVQSGNDAAIAIAENMGGTEQIFAKMMTEEARRLGLAKSVFKNATGLPNPEHLMTVREIAMLARHIIKTYPEYYSLFALREFPYRKHKFINRNPLLGAVDGVDGLKTGYTKEAGYGIVASAKRDDRRLIVVVSGCATAEERKDDARRLLEWGFHSFSEVKLFDAGEVVGHARVWGGDRFYVPLTGKGEVDVVLPRFPANQKLSARIYYNAPLKPPLKKGQQVAMLRITTTSQATNEVPLYVAEDIEPGGMVRRGLDSLWYLATGWMP